MLGSAPQAATLGVVTATDTCTFLMGCGLSLLLTETYFTLIVLLRVLKLVWPTCKLGDII